ncbi:dihydrolipoyl dehydrogenase [Aureococcus anophagefferens]|nr:dihydrolipoyl dehydrogenase [Aureococcus anophagefferens]
MPSTSLESKLLAEAAAVKHGHVGRAADGAPVSWGRHLSEAARGSPAVDGRCVSYLPELPESSGGRGCTAHIDLDTCGISPLDEHNAKLLDNVHPEVWQDPTPEPGFVYDLVALGAGAGGLVSAKQAARRGARSALIESHLAGGDCLNVGCVPSKALLRARGRAEARRGAEFGVDGAAVAVDFGAGRGVFVGPNEIEVNGQTLKFRKAVVATGGQAAVPSIPGLAEAPYHTNATLFNATALPPRVVVVGAGPIGLEMAQALAVFGSKRDGVAFVTGAAYKRVEHAPPKGAAFPTIGVASTPTALETRLECEMLLVATGRKPNVEHCGLDKAGVAFDVRDGVQVDDYLRTTNPDVYAVGDVCTRYQFTHVAGTMAGMVVDNALFRGRHAFSKLVVPWATYTEPEVAHVGLYERDVASQGLACDTYTTALAHNDRAILEGATEGFVKVHCRKGTDEILGATIVATTLAKLISELTLAIQANVGLGTIGKTIHPYPTVSGAIAGCGVAYNRTVWKTKRRDSAAAAPGGLKLALAPRPGRSRRAGRGHREARAALGERRLGAGKLEET